MTLKLWVCVCVVVVCFFQAVALFSEQIVTLVLASKLFPVRHRSAGALATNLRRRVASCRARRACWSGYRSTRGAPPSAVTSWWVTTTLKTCCSSCDVEGNDSWIFYHAALLEMNVKFCISVCFNIFCVYRNLYISVNHFRQAVDFFCNDAC